MESQIVDENAVSRQNVPKSACKQSASKSKLRRALTVTFHEENGKSVPLDEDLSLLPGRPSIFQRENLMVEGISRIESVGDANETQFTESFGLSESAANAETTDMNEMVKFETTIEGQAYIVTILENESSMVASFFNVSKGTTQVRRLNSTWRNPPIDGSQLSKNDWYKENIAAVLLRNRGPEATPKQPPRRPPPTAAEPVRLSALTEQHSTISQSRSDLDVSRLRNELQEATKHHADLTSQLQRNTEEFEARLSEWKQRLEDSQAAAEASRKEWTQMVAQRDAEIEELKSKHFEERERLLKEISTAKDAEASARQEVLELRLALRRAEEKAETMAKLSTDDDHQPTAKRVRTEQEIWAEAEKILALSRVDVAEARQAREAAELRASEQEMKAKEAIENCEKFLNIATTRIAELESELATFKGK